MFSSISRIQKVLYTIGIIVVLVHLFIILFPGKSSEIPSWESVMWLVSPLLLIGGLYSAVKNNKLGKSKLVVIDLLVAFVGFITIPIFFILLMLSIKLHL